MEEDGSTVFDGDFERADCGRGRSLVESSDEGRRDYDQRRIKHKCL
jgi:hypothetical protein